MNTHGHIDHVGHGGTILHPSAAEVIASLARQGYGRRFELRQGQLWCPSCDVVFDAHQLEVDTAIMVQGEQGTSTVYAVRCAKCGAAGTWLVSQPGPEELGLIRELRGAVVPRTTDRETPST